MRGFAYAAWAAWIEREFPLARQLAADGGTYLWYFERLAESAMEAAG